MCEMDEALGWKDEQCGKCVFWVEMPRAILHGAQDMSVPRMGHCRHSPPGVVGVMMKGPEGMGLQTHGMYPPTSHDCPACSRFALNVVGALRG